MTGDVLTHGLFAVDDLPIGPQQSGSFWTRGPWWSCRRGAALRISPAWRRAGAVRSPALRAGGAPRPHPVPVLRAPHLHDRPADRQLDLAVELVGRAVRLDRVPGHGLVGRLGPRPAVGAGETDGVRAHGTGCARHHIVSIIMWSPRPQRSVPAALVHELGEGRTSAPTRSSPSDRASAASCAATSPSHRASRVRPSAEGCTTTRRRSAGSGSR